LTDFSAELRSTGRVRTGTELTATSQDGYPVHGWVTLPDPERFGDGPHPTILMIHGGPFAQYTHALFDEVQVLVEAGYAVVHGNPRGSSGYGRAHGLSIKDGFGTVDADDVLALLDAALQDPALDADRVGVMGGSYGGYMTAWLTTRTDRFVAAIVERGFLDPVSFVGSSDIGWFFGGAYLGEDPKAVAAQSPMAHVGNVTTPTLVIHSEQDWRCPVEQGQRWFVELKRRGVRAELLLFPGEGHELTRSGRPAHRRARFEHVLDWWARYLPVR
jgi:dipeptidyl aminopeptidase/acylaminoacyl peptidase